MFGSQPTRPQSIFSQGGLFAGRHAAEVCTVASTTCLVSGERHRQLSAARISHASIGLLDTDQRSQVSLSAKSPLSVHSTCQTFRQGTKPEPSAPACEPSCSQRGRVKPPRDMILSSPRNLGDERDPTCVSRYTRPHTHPMTTPLALVRTAVARWPSARLSQTDATTARGQRSHPLGAQTAPTDLTSPGPKEPTDQPARVARPGREGETFARQEGCAGAEYARGHASKQAIAKVVQTAARTATASLPPSAVAGCRALGASGALPLGSDSREGMVERTWRCERQWVPMLRSGRGAAAETRWRNQRSTEVVCMAPETLFTSQPRMLLVR